MIRSSPTMTTKTISYQEVVDVVMTLPEDRLVSVYDFACFITIATGGHDAI